MKLEVKFAEGVDAEQSSNESVPVHPLSLLPADRAEELEKRVKGVALGMSRRYGLDPEDLFQEGMAGICKKFKIGDTVGGMIMMSRFAMREFVRREFDERSAIKEATSVWHSLRRTSRTFEQLEIYLQKLPPFEGQVMRMWLDGQTPKAIGRQVGRHGKVVKDAIGRATGIMAEMLGKKACVECLWPEISRCLPKHVYLKHGKFVVRVGRAGCRYLGTFDTLDEAIKVLGSENA